ncbi:hypothetical protein OQA88_3027 [Cercophora sp. LCS_1]
MARFTILLLAALAIAKPTPNHQCIDLEIPIHLNTTAIKWLQPRVDNTIDAVDWVTYETTWSTPNVTQSILGTVPITTTFTISGQLCIPPPNPRSSTLQIATHGIGFDKRYWSAPGSNSYTSAALAAGYPIFTYDRLGAGASTKPDAYTIVQTSVQVEILSQITSFFRSGTLLSSSKITRGSLPDKGFVPKKIIHVGHSLGSILTIALLNSAPTLSDGAVLTGFLYTNQLDGAGPGTWGFEYAAESDRKFKDRGSGYIVQGSKSSVQQTFFKKGGFEKDMLDWAWEVRQPGSVSEFVSLGTVLGAPSSFEGGVLFVIGENDYGFCRGDCKGTYDLGVLKTLYPAAKEVGVHLQPGTGHGLALAKNATAGYEVIFDFLGGSGL